MIPFRPYVPVAQLQLDQLQDWVSRLILQDDWFDRHLCFKSEGYQRQLVCRTPCFDLLILCWQPGQSSLIHDRQELLNVMRVHQRQLTSRSFRQPVDPSWPFGSATVPLLCQETYLEQGYLAVVDRHHIHQLANTADNNLVTLHVDARPLQAITRYYPNSGNTQILPVNY